MDVKKCDSCGHVYEFDGNRVFRIYTRHWYGVDQLDTVIDLCNECFLGLKKIWLAHSGKREG